MSQTGQLGGGELSILEYVRSTSNLIEAVIFSDGPLRNELISLNIPVHYLDIGPVANVRRSSSVVDMLAVAPTIRELRKKIQTLSNNFDLVYANSQKAFIVCALCVPRHVPLVWHLRDVLSSEHFSYAVRRLATIVGNRTASIIITNSQATKAAFVASGGSAKKAVVVYNGVNHAPYERVTEEEVRALREGLGLTRAFVIGGFGRLTPWKGQDVLIKALALLPLHVHALIVGAAIFGEVVYAENLKRLAEQLGVSDRVHFLGFRKDIPLLMSAVDVVVHTAIAPEPFGRVLVEGMLANRPVIATNIGGTPEILEHENSGLLTSPNSELSLVEAISWVMNDPLRAKLLAARGFNRARHSFSASAMVRGIDTVLKDVKALN